jgi:hypothetical protein
LVELIFEITEWCSGGEAPYRKGRTMKLSRISSISKQYRLADEGTMDHAMSKLEILIDRIQNLPGKLITLSARGTLIESAEM